MRLKIAIDKDISEEIYNKVLNYLHECNVEYSAEKECSIDGDRLALHINKIKKHDLHFIDKIINPGYFTIENLKRIISLEEINIEN